MQRYLSLGTHTTAALLAAHHAPSRFGPDEVTQIAAYLRPEESRRDPAQPIGAFIRNED